MLSAIGSPLEGVLSSFSPEADALALSSGGGRIKVWDVSSGSLRADLVDVASTSASISPIDARERLALQYTALAWGQPATSTTSKSKKKAAKHATAALVTLVVGTASGDVLAWDTALGEVKWRSNECHQGAVGGLAFAPGGRVVYSGGADGHVCELDAATGTVLSKFRAGKRAISCTAASPDGGHLLVASSELKLLDLASKKRLRKFTGHTAPVRALAFNPDGEFAFSAAPGDRHVAVWRCAAGRGVARSEDGAVALLAMEEPAVSISCAREGSGDGEGVTIAAVGEDGEAYVWEGEGVVEAAGSKPLRITVASKGSKPKRGRPPGSEVVLAVRPLGRALVLVAQGTVAKPRFQQVQVEPGGGAVVLEAAENGALVRASRGATPASGKKGPGAAITVVGPESVVDEIKGRVVEGGSERKKKKEGKRKKWQEEGDAAGEERRAADKEGGQTSGAPPEDEEEHEETLGEKIAALGLVDDAGEGPGEEAGASLRRELVGVGSAPRAASLQVLLSQALQSDDVALLERVLGVGDEKVMTHTARRLSPQDASKFLSMAVARFHSRPTRGIHLLPWIRTLLLQHAGYLMSAPAVQGVLVGLSRTIEARVAVFRPMAELLGRLDLVMAQIAAASGSGAGAELPEDVAATAALYEEGASDDDGAGGDEALEDVMDAETGSEYSEDEDNDDEDARGGREEGHGLDEGGEEGSLRSDEEL